MSSRGPIKGNGREGRMVKEREREREREREIKRIYAIDTL